METSTKRIFTPARVIALVLIAILIGGLIDLAVSPDQGWVALPSGAEAGDLALEACEYPTEDGQYAADCGTLVAPENRSDPQSRLIALPVTRIRARAAEPAEPIFFLTGGPGQSNVEFPQASRLAENHDVVLVGYRGIDGSIRLDCPEVESALEQSTDYLNEASLRAYSDAFRSCADRLTDEGVDLDGYGMVQQVDDMEAARIALGYDRVNLLSESAGTRTAMIYAWRYPESIHRSVMFGVNPPGGFLYDAGATDEQIERFAGLCAEDAACSARTDDLAASMSQIGAEMPDRWLFLPIREGNVKTLSFTLLMQSTSEGGITSAPGMFDGWLSAGEGDSSGLWFMSLVADALNPKLFVWGQYAAAAMVDAEAAKQYFSSSGAEVPANLGNLASAFAWGGGRLADSWPGAPGNDDYSVVPRSEVETLLIGGELDTATPPSIATRELLPHLPNGQEVILPGFSHSPSFWSDQPAAGATLITTFFDSGRVDDSGYQPQSLDFTLEMTSTAIGKIVAGSLVLLALVTVASLLWMPSHVDRRGSFGSVSGAMLRSLYAIVLGLGGWSVGALLVMTVMPQVSFDNDLLVMVTVGVPVGLGVYWAWVHSDWSARSKGLGMVVAGSSAVVGAWLGLVAGDRLGVLTAILGAVAGANLALLILDIWWDQMGYLRSGRAADPDTVARQGVPLEGVGR